MSALFSAAFLFAGVSAGDGSMFDLAAVMPTPVIEGNNNPNHTTQSFQVRVATNTNGSAHLLLDTGSSGIAICPGLVNVDDYEVVSQNGTLSLTGMCEGTVYRGNLILGNEVRFVLKDAEFVVCDRKAITYCQLGASSVVEGGILGVAHLASSLKVGGLPVRPAFQSFQQVGVYWDGMFGSKSDAMVYLDNAALNNDHTTGTSIDLPMMSPFDKFMTVPASKFVNCGNNTYAETGFRLPVLFDTGNPSIGTPGVGDFILMTPPFTSTGCETIMTEIAGKRFTLDNLGPIFSPQPGVFGAIQGWYGPGYSYGMPAFLYFYIVADFSTREVRLWKAVKDSKPAAKAFFNNTVVENIRGSSNLFVLV